AHPVRARLGARRQDACGPVAGRLAPHPGAPRGRVGELMETPPPRFARPPQGDEARGPAEPVPRRPWGAPRWLATSVRNKLLAMALLPLLVAFPLLLMGVALWSQQVYDRLLVTKVRSDLAVAQGYFDQVLGDVGSGTLGVAD